MSKTYKGYELYKMIAEGKIKGGTKFKEDTDIIEFNGCNFIFADTRSAVAYRYDDISIAQMDFELIEDEIDIQSIEELKGIDVMKSVDEKATREENLRRIDKIGVDYFYKINDIVKQQNLILEAVKQLNRKSGGK